MRPPGGPRSRRRADSSAEATGDPVDQVVRLVDDDHVVLGQDDEVLQRVDRQQGVVGDHDVRPAGLLARLLGEALGAERAALGPEHSLAVTATCRQACSVTPGTSSSRSPVLVVSAHSCSRCTCLPTAEAVAGRRARPAGLLGAHAQALQAR